MTSEVDATINAMKMASIGKVRDYLEEHASPELLEYIRRMFELCKLEDFLGNQNQLQNRCPRCGYPIPSLCSPAPAAEDSAS